MRDRITAIWRRIEYEKALFIPCFLAEPSLMALFDEGIYDSLTGLLSPAYFYESAERLLSWAERSHHPVSLISIRLPDLNDDLLLKCARDLVSELRGGDLLARIGDQSFALLLLGDKLGAEQLIFRLRNTIEVGEGIEAGLQRLSI
ncbi:MAG: diguanylate cyclase [Burkholderiaceae bacterium]|nr:diguanylate cyclase [Burkholderiaceae bacterium]